MIKGVQDNFFIDKNDVIKLLMVVVNGKVKGQLIVFFNLRNFEQLLKDNIWISDVDLYFDNQDVLYIIVMEWEFVVRIFIIINSFFYIDSSGKCMLLLDRFSVRVLVFISFFGRQVFIVKDSVLFNDVKRILVFILNNEFWMSQVE